MAKAISTFFDRLIARRELHRWTAEARNAATAPLPALRQSRTRARTLKARLDDLIHTADGRLALPLIGSNIFPVPHGTDWSWRPDIWRGPLPLRGRNLTDEFYADWSGYSATQVYIGEPRTVEIGWTGRF